VAKKKTWGRIKDYISKQPSKDLIKLLRELYDLNEQNSRFLDTKFASSATQLTRYKEIIRRGIYPDALSKETFDIKSARRAISDFRKASEDQICILELRVYYVEQGNQCTIDYGDINERFYASIESMFDEIIKHLKKNTPETVTRFLPRLRTVVKEADGIGWGYYDYLSDAIETAFPEN